MESDEIDRVAISLFKQIATDIHSIALVLQQAFGPAGISVKESEMKMKILKKQSAAKAPPHKPQAAVGDLQLLDNGSGSYTVQGVDAAGNPLDLSQTFTITVSSGNTALLTVSTTGAVTFWATAVGPLGTGILVTVVATATAGSPGPFTGTASFDIITSGPTGIQIIPTP
jgi:uncharacterized iron-regulated membrane protein